MEKVNVLVVSEESSILEMITSYFLGNENIEICYQEKDFTRALQVMNEKTKIHLILIDLDMKDSFSFLEEIKKEANKKMIVFSSNSLFLPKVLEYEVNYFMLKPIAMEELEKRMKKIFEIQKSKVVDFQKGSTKLQITKILHDLGMPSNMKGYHYLREAILLVIEDHDLLESITKKLYPEVALAFHSTSVRVERSMRHAIEVSFIRGNLDVIEEIFRFSMDRDKAKPTNSEFHSTKVDKFYSSQKSFISSIINL